jgi:hypothetical protein
MRNIPHYLRDVPDNLRDVPQNMRDENQRLPPTNLGRVDEEKALVKAESAVGATSL